MSQQESRDPLADSHERAHGVEFDRRQFLICAGSTAVGGGLISGLLAACGSSSPSSGSSRTRAAAIGGTLNMLAWEPYPGNGIIDAWRKANHITIKNYVLQSNDQILTEMRAGGVGHYSLLTPNIAYAPLLNEAGVLQPIDYSRIPNTASIFPPVLETARPVAEIDGHMYAIPYMWGYDGMIYNASRIPEPTSWMDVLKPEYKGKVIMLQGVGVNWEIWPRVLGYDLANLTKAQNADVVKFLIHLKKTQVRALLPDFVSAAKVLASGDAVICCSGAFLGIAQALAAAGHPVKGDKIGTTLTKDGGASWIDSWQIAKNAPNLDTVYAYLNHMYSVPVQAKVAQENVLAPANDKAVPLLSPSNKAAFDYSSIASTIGTARAPLFRFSVNGGPNTTSYSDWQQAWEQVQAA